MTIEQVIRGAVIAVLEGDAWLARTLNRIGDGEGEDAPVPFASVGEASGSEWGSKDRPGREVRLALSLFDRGDGARLAGLVDAVEAALAAMPRAIGAVETGGAVVTRTRLVRRRDGMRIALIDVRVRAWRAG